MKNALERLIALAQKTGDTLIIHQPGKHDVVIMDVDRYEAIVEDFVESCDDEDDYFEYEDGDYKNDEVRFKGNFKGNNESGKTVYQKNMTNAREETAFDYQEYPHEAIMPEPLEEAAEETYQNQEEFSITDEGREEERRGQSNIESSWHSTRHILERRHRGNTDSKNLLDRTLRQKNTINFNDEPFDFEDDEDGEPVFYEEPL